MLFTIASCKDDTAKAVQENNTVEEETEQDTVPTVSGKFIFTEKDAILRGDDFIYNVEIDSLSRNLGKQVEAYKTDDFEMVPVKVKGKIKQFTGISDPYEKPSNPEITVNSDGSKSPEEIVEIIYEKIKHEGYI